ncbi:twin-arginine translocation signal domain-containing protein [Glycomyces harbinensis]|uniref:Tat (Twin-arginine translocation) pathway signal sequence n=1 Tax=Glycomyces harbinensis TaxID=58114 RepID=A0A1G6QQB5_9ACTN|nr:twin-arginine translocation signal domain-containing protein [Glycomyces harbinensis]SDC94463.1 Tat (twin-arginine translocation) pathway signal sequence [Glycomyces harbinensis]
MTDQQERPNISRRRLIQVATVLPAAAIPALVVASPAEAAYNGNIRRSEVLLRARNWYNRDISYNQGRRASDREGNHTYRQDCSGFASMSWHSPTPGHSTRSIPNISSVIDWADLKPGDVINKYDYHCMIFEKWTTPSGSMRLYELTTAVMGMRCKTYTISNLRAAGYLPRKYHKIVSG